MSQRLKTLSGRDVAAIFVRLGFQVVTTRGSHCKLRRTLRSGERQTLTIPLHASLATGTLHAIYRQASRFIAAGDLEAHFYSGEAPPGSGRESRDSPRTRPRGGTTKHKP